ncbi:protein adenylyltransferase SelO family protein [Kordiimonas marina]|uniref:protein adenylyltransferase SelO family protein n=1 Tax=Kordiimonas marina TaxID=2872312 RepID=UPI001FF10F86|nr:YdiU family protein [Kordiimonas marina]MCJ9428510.1 YdiU family protein [Kordiimonas marina]
MPVSPAYRPETAFLTLGEGFADPVEAAQFPETKIRFRNDRAAAEVGLADLTDDEWAAHFGRFAPLPGSLEKPLAQRYHGHQFRVYNPEIGDGRGFLFAQLRDTQNRLMDLGTKGSGLTPFSRTADGRLTLKGGVREIMASEMLEALGTYTSRTFSIIETGESLMRHDEPSPTRSAVMTRLTHGHIRIGTFQRHAFYTDTERLEKLVDYCLTHYYGVTPKGSAADRALDLLGRVSERVARQGADLMAAGFVHGVLNTDNINITGEIFDFGPWRFLPTLELGFTAAYFDETGLYAYGRQADALHWNIYQLGGALADLAPEDALKDVLAPFPHQYVAALRTALMKRLGLKPKDDAADDAMLTLVNNFMLEEDVGYERFFFDWYGGAASLDRAMKSPEAARYNAEKWQDMKAALMAYGPARDNALSHPYFDRAEPCTMLIDEVEEIWAHIAERDDWQPLYDKIDRIREMGEALKG